MCCLRVKLLGTKTEKLIWQNWNWSGNNASFKSWVWVGDADSLRANIRYRYHIKDLCAVSPRLLSMFLWNTEEGKWSDRLCNTCICISSQRFWFSLAKWWHAVSYRWRNLTSLEYICEIKSTLCLACYCCSFAIIVSCVALLSEV